MRATILAAVLLLAGQASAEPGVRRGMPWLAASVVRELPRATQPAEKKLLAQASSATCNMTEIAATKEATPTLDDKLQKFKKMLGKTPFTTWNTFKVVTENKFTLQAGGQVSSSRKTGGTLVLLFKDKVTSQKRKKARLKLHLDLEDAGGKRFVNNDYTEDVGNPRGWVTGEKVETADYILVLTCSSP